MHTKPLTFPYGPVALMHASIPGYQPAPAPPPVTPLSVAPVVPVIPVAMVRLLGNVNAGSTWGGARHARARQASHAKPTARTVPATTSLTVIFPFSLMVLSLLRRLAKYTHCSAHRRITDHELRSVVPAFGQPGWQRRAHDAECIGLRDDLDHSVWLILARY